VPRALLLHFADDAHPNGRRVLSKTTGEIDAGRAYEIAKPTIGGWKTRFTELRALRKTATQLKAEHLAKQYAKARNLDPTEADYIKLIDVLYFAARELVGPSARAWHERLVAFDLDPAMVLRSMAGGDDAMEQIEFITGNLTPFLTNIIDKRADAATRLDAKTGDGHSRDVGGTRQRFDPDRRTG
jgi:hypothetical protein